MSTQAITQPSRSYRSPRTALLAVLALVVGGLIGAGVVALSSSSGSDTHRATAQATPVVAPGNVTTCAGDGGALLATVASMPIDVTNDVVSRLSAPTRALLTSAAETNAQVNIVAEARDTATLAGALARVGSADAAVVMSGLSPETRAAVSGTTAEAACR